MPRVWLNSGRFKLFHYSTCGSGTPFVDILSGIERVMTSSSTLSLANPAFIIEHMQKNLLRLFHGRPGLYLPPNVLFSSLGSRD